MSRIKQVNNTVVISTKPRVEQLYITARTNTVPGYKSYLLDYLSVWVTQTYPD